MTLAVLASACGGRLLGVGVPSCGSGFENQNGSALFVQAQSVDTATRLPCVEDLPTGWSFSSFIVEREEAVFTLDSDRVGARFVTVSLEPECAPAGDEVPSDEPGTRLFVDVAIDDDTYAGTWHYLFEGGCVEYMFHAEGEDLSELPAAVADTLGLEPVTPYAEQVAGDAS